MSLLRNKTFQLLTIGIQVHRCIYKIHKSMKIEITFKEKFPYLIRQNQPTDFTLVRRDGISHIDYLITLCNL